MSYVAKWGVYGYLMDRIMEYPFSNDELVILNWIERLVTKNEGLQKGKAFLSRNTSEQRGLNRDDSNGIYYWVDTVDGVNESFRYYMLNFDKLMADLRNISNSQKTYSRYLDHLCGLGITCDKTKIHPLAKIVRYCEFGKKTFFCLNPAVVLYLKGEVDSMNDLFDDKVQPVENLPKKEYSPLSEEFLSFYKKACKIYDFKHKLPKDNESPSAILAKSQEYFEAILANKFNPKLKKPCEVDLSDSSSKLILKALMRYVEWMEVNRPKEKLSLDTFFYNPKQMMSYFLINYSMDSSERKDNAQREDNREFLDTSDDPEFDELYDDLCQRSSYNDIGKDKVVHNSFYRLYKKVEADSDKFDKANIHCRFLERCFWPEFIENTYWKDTLVADDFNMESKRSAKFVRALERRGYRVFMDRENHEENERLWKDALAKDREKGEDAKKARNANKSIDELDGVVVDLTQEEQETAKEQKRCSMLQTIGMMLDDLFYYENNKDMGFEEVEKKYKEIGGEYHG